MNTASPVTLIPVNTPSGNGENKEQVDVIVPARSLESPEDAAQDRLDRATILLLEWLLSTDEASCKSGESVLFWKGGTDNEDPSCERQSAAR